MALRRFLTHSSSSFVWSCTSSKRFYNSKIDSNKLSIELTQSPKPKSALNNLKFGSEFTDHMLEIDWNEKDGWKDPIIKPFDKFQIDPSASVFHYALEAFEGLKSYRDQNDKIRMFRPFKNWDRLNDSCDVLCFPKIDPDEVQNCVEKLLSLEREWIPKEDGFSLYLRPTVISTHPFIGVGPAKSIKFYCILSPVGPFFREGFAAVSLWATDKYVRAWPGGCGGNKVGLNYAGTIRAQMEAAALGYSQVLWLLPTTSDTDQNTVSVNITNSINSTNITNNIRHRVEEVGTMNIFMLWINSEGEKELVTPPLSGTILPGVTRDSVLEISKGYNEFRVSERAFFMDEIEKANEENRILEVFGTGTAVIISPVKEIGYKGKVMKIPLDIEDPTQQAGPLARKLWKHIIDIQYGRKEHPWSWVVNESEQKFK